MQLLFNSAKNEETFIHIICQVIDQLPGKYFPLTSADSKLGN